jgi:hypothetical protein
MATRLIVIELGKFIRKAQDPETKSPAHLQLLHRQTAQRFCRSFTRFANAESGMGGRAFRFG